MPDSLQSINLEDARELLDHILKLALNDGRLPVAIAVVDVTGKLLASACMCEVKEPSVANAHAKAVTAVKFVRDTVEFRFRETARGIWDRDTADGWSDNDLADARSRFQNFCSWAGGSLVLSPHDGSILGAIGVSNREELEDHELASQRPSGWTA